VTGHTVQAKIPWNWPARTYNFKISHRYAALHGERRQGRARAPQRCL